MTSEAKRDGEGQLDPLSLERGVLGQLKLRVHERYGDRVLISFPCGTPALLVREDGQVLPHAYIIDSSTQRGLRPNVDIVVSLDGLLYPVEIRDISNGDDYFRQILVCQESLEDKQGKKGRLPNRGNETFDRKDGKKWFLAHGKYVIYWGDSYSADDEVPENAVIYRNWLLATDSFFRDSSQPRSWGDRIKKGIRGTFLGGKA